MTLLEQIELAMRREGLSTSQIRWVGSRDGVNRLLWDTFAFLADTVSVTPQRANTIVARDLVVVGDTWWMELVETDGAQGWRLMRQPRPVGTAQSFTQLETSRSSPMTLRRLNFGGE